jgi:hypothetical protein
MGKVFYFLIIIVIVVGVYFTVQTDDNKLPLDKKNTIESLPKTDGTIKPEPESIIEEESDTTPPPVYPTPVADLDSGIDTLPPIVETEIDQEPQPNPVTVIILANDLTANPKNITVEKGAKVTLIFQVDTQNVYYGGLDFRSSVVDTGTINSGESKTVSFTALASFDFTPYWPASGVKKDYKINILVE